MNPIPPLVNNFGNLQNAENQPAILSNWNQRQVQTAPANPLIPINPHLLAQPLNPQLPNTLCQQPNPALGQRPTHEVDPNVVASLLMNNLSNIQSNSVTQFPMYFPTPATLLPVSQQLYAQPFHLPLMHLNFSSPTQLAGLSGAPTAFIDYNDPAWIASRLIELNNHSVDGKILTVNQSRLKGLGYFKLPDSSNLPIKFDFPLTSEQLSILNYGGIKNFTIEGTLRMDIAAMTNYVFSHDIGSFQELRTQNKPADQIPIAIDQIVLMDRHGTRV